MLQGVEIQKNQQMSAWMLQFRDLIQDGDVAGARRILENTPALANTMIDIGWYDFTPMGLAAAHGTSEMVRLMQEFGGDVNGTNKDGSTPMHYAALYGHVEVVQVLTSSGFGADVNKPNDTGHTSMHCAAEEGHVEVVQVLHRFGGDVNKASDDGVTPLMMACDKGCVSLVKLLIGFGANISPKDQDGRGARDYAVEAGHTEVVSFLDEEMRRRLRTFLLGTLKRRYKTTTPVLMLNQDVLGMIASNAISTPTQNIQ